MPAPTPRKPDRPIFWIVAGPNGSGKSSLYNRTDIEGWGGSVWIINPDLLTATIVEHESISLNEANLAAVNRIEQWLESSIQTYQTIGVETVLSSGKYRRLVDFAHERGFEVRMLFVMLQSLELQLARIKERVARGGHDVPADKVAARRARSFEQFCWFAMHADLTFVFDNSAATPKLAAVWDGRSLDVRESLPADFLSTLKQSGVQLVHHLR